MAQDLGDGGSFGRIIVENPGNEVSRSVRNLDVVREVIGIHSDSLVGCLDVRGLEGRLPDNQCVQNDSK